MQEEKALKLLFIINKSSGNDDKNWRKLIQEHFHSTNHTIEIFELPESCQAKDIVQKIKSFKANKVIAVGGDGTVKLTAQSCLETHIPLGILPAGSANGMAKELGIPEDAKKAMDILTEGNCKKIHLTKVNDELCIHLSDIGFNAFVIKKFDNEDSRGMWGYFKAAWNVLLHHPVMDVEMHVDGETKHKRAAMIVIANATKYGTGALINPQGSLEDDVFEVIVVKKISLKEIFKMVVTHTPYDHAKTEVYQTGFINIKSERKAHFQVDGEYLGKVNEVKASILPHAVEVIVPSNSLPNKSISK